MKPMRNERNIPVNAVEDLDLKIRGGGHPDPEIGGAGLQNKLFGPSGLSLVEE